MSPSTVLVLLVTFAFSTVGFCQVEAETDSSKGPSNSVKAAFEKSIQIARDGIDRAKDAIGGVREKIAPIASNFSTGFKEHIESGVERAAGILNRFKDSVSPYVDRARAGMLDRVRSLRERLRGPSQNASEPLHVDMSGKEFEKSPEMPPARVDSETEKP